MIWSQWRNKLFGYIASGGGLRAFNLNRSSPLCDVNPSTGIGTGEKLSSPIIMAPVAAKLASEQGEVATAHVVKGLVSLATTSSYSTVDLQVGHLTQFYFG